MPEEDHCFLCGAEYTALTAWKNGKLICFPCRYIEEDAEAEGDPDFIEMVSQLPKEIDYLIDGDNDL